MNNVLTNEDQKLDGENTLVASSDSVPQENIIVNLFPINAFWFHVYYWEQEFCSVRT